MKILNSSILVVVCSLLAFNAFSQKKVSLTIDDLPVVSYGINTPAHLNEVTDKLISTFKQYQVPAIGYVNEIKLYSNGKRDKFSISLLEKWLSNGYELGNHTYSHIDYHKVTLERFSEDFLKGEKIIKPLAKKYDQDIRFFRHPFLRSGETKERSEALEEFIRSKGYLSAPVTLNSDDYLFAQAYAQAYKEKDETEMETIGIAYIDHTEKKLKFYESLSEAVFDRAIAHTYLMHANLLNADYLDELCDMFKKNGYTFVSQSEVLKDPAYAEPVTKFGNWGMSWLYRWSLSKDKGKALFVKDIPLPAFLKTPD
ncbi:polysaccharide deacetylase-like protein [Roseivirga sp. 4D4]|uniref:polysaccharide deacetylase family protein n=1 Tax=Roseivirga sp. 4D4 TaxID=1889784 RepID=UPI000852AEA0|nr:polysaccharide deacetylase family protein [Roseivirga sp. 4D4]OEK00446.1 polysaccharide deacetylase-like protein [Roseivirga sp. 4D4]